MGWDDWGPYPGDRVGGEGTGGWTRLDGEGRRPEERDDADFRELREWAKAQRALEAAAPAPHERPERPETVDLSTTGPVGRPVLRVVPDESQRPSLRERIGSVADFLSTFAEGEHARQVIERAWTERTSKGRDRQERR